MNNTGNWYQMPGSVNLTGRSGCAVRYALRLSTDFPSSIDALEVDGSTGNGTWEGISYEYDTTPGYGADKKIVAGICAMPPEEGWMCQLPVLGRQTAESRVPSPS